jgi:dTDP-glucose pyrophosphorylase
MKQIDRNTKGIALVVDDGGRLLGTITDGDLRRLVLAGADLNAPSAAFVRAKKPAITAPKTASRAQKLRTMREHNIRQLPLLANGGVVCDLAILDDFVAETPPALSAVVMAGGEGSRLRPLTNSTPKPMLPVGDKPIIERTIEQLRQAGVSQLFLATHYKNESFPAYFGDGSDFGVSISYLNEERPLGTAGCLSRLGKSEGPLLIVNGDILTNLNYRSMLAFHQENAADMSVAVRHYEFRVPYGVVSTEGAEVKGLVEKPEHRFFVNAGIYLLEPEMCKYVPRGERFDMTDLIAKLLADARRVTAFPVSEYWIDVGDLEDYEQARADAEKELRKQ